MKNDYIKCAISKDFYKIMQRARDEYSEVLGKEITMIDVTRIWGKGNIVKFEIPKIKEEIL